jgi:alpha-mannosidase
MRPGPQEKGLPARLFHWEGDDGSRVLAYRIPFEYCTWGHELGKHIRRAAGELRAPLDELMCFYGVGNHGGGPTIENLRSIRRLRDEPGMPALIHSSPNRFFAAVEARAVPLPTYHGDLQHHASGCYAAHSAVKQWNRRAEWALLTAEKWAAVASLLGGPAYPREELTRAWQGVLFNQFHDILAGTSIESAYEDARNLYGEALSIADRALTNATVAVAWRVRTPYAEGARPLVVFNAHAWPARVCVEAEFGAFTETHSLVDDQGRQVPVQRVQSEATVSGRSRLCFSADLPALGYRSYMVVPRAPALLAVDPFAGTGDTVLENTHLRVTFDPVTGWIGGLFDKGARVEALAGPAAVPMVVRDESDTWGHNVFSFRDEVGRFTATSVRLIARGPARATLRVVSRYEESRLVQDFSLAADGRTLDVSAVLDWRERHKALKLRFPIDVHFHRATAEQPFGSIERFANGDEEPGQSWVDCSGTSRASGERYGVSIFNDGKYSYDVTIRDIGLTVLRSPIFAHHDPVTPHPGEEYSYIDQGIQRFRYAVYPHAGGWEEAETVRLAAQLNQPPLVVQGTFHPVGDLPRACAFADASPANIVITALKQSEDGNDLIVRAYESAHATTAGQILLPGWGRVISAVFRPGEIKTWRVPRNSGLPVTQVNLIEWEA